jgi:hypothetical protein
MTLGLPAALKAVVEQRIGAAELAAETCLYLHQDALLQLTDILLERRELVGDELAAVLADLGLREERDAPVSVSVV